MSGRIVTFYSWKGGVGRTMSMANVGVQLARRGNRVLLVDWDLEAPGLDRYFLAADQATASQLEVTKPADGSGLLGLLTSEASQWAAGNLGEACQRRCITIQVPGMPVPARPASSVAMPKPISVLPAGLGFANYAAQLQSLSWTEFFAQHDGGHWLERLREHWRENYEFVLIDSRTGLTDSGGVCTVQMPDVLVFAFTPNNQSLEDGLAFLDGVQKARAAFAFERAPLTLVPLLCRWEGDKEVDLADDWTKRIEVIIAPLVDTWLPSDIPRRRMLERLRVPHVARFSFGEPLPVLTHSLTDPVRPGLAYDLLSELLSEGFSAAGRIIEPGYQPTFDPTQATDAEIEAFVADDQARKTLLESMAARPDGPPHAQISLLIRLAEASVKLGRLAVANEAALRALAIARDGVTTNPGNMDGLRTLVRALLVQADIRRDLGDLLAAKLGYGQALEVVRAQNAADPLDSGWQHDLSVSQNKVGDVLQAQGDLAGALAAYEESLAVSERLARADAGNAGWQRDLTVSYNKVGDVRQAQGDLAGARAAYETALAVSERLARADAGNAGWQRDLSVSYEKIGNVRQAQGDLAGAREAYETALAVRERLARADAGNAGWQRDLSISYEKVGEVRQAQGDLAGARAAYETALAVSERLARADAANAGWQRDLSVGYIKVGEVRQAQGDLADARAAYETALAVRERLALADESNASWQRDLASIYRRVSHLLSQSGDHEEALKMAIKSAAISEKLAALDTTNATWRSDAEWGLQLMERLRTERAAGENRPHQS